MKPNPPIPKTRKRASALLGLALQGAVLSLASAAHAASVRVRQPAAPCHQNLRANSDIEAVLNRGDVRRLPDPLRAALATLAGRPHSQLPTQAFAEADQPSRLFQYYLLDSNGFEPNVFTKLFAGINDNVMLTATGGNCGLPTVGAVREVVEPKPDLPTSPNNVRAFIDVFTDISGLFVINNESGWYEGWMIHNLTVPDSAPTTRPNGRALFGMLTTADKTALALMGGAQGGNNVPGHVFTTDGRAAHVPNAGDHWPDRQSNVVPIQLSMGAYNALQGLDVHAYWEFNYTTNWVAPLYELPFTGGIPGTFEAGQIGAHSSLVPGPGPSGVQNDPVQYGDNPNTAGVLQGAGPRDPDRFDGDDDSQREFRMRFVPSGLANEIFLDVYERIASFEPGTPFPQRLFDAYAYEVSLVDTDGDGVISAAEGDVDTKSDGFDDNARLFLPATAFKWFAVTREINDGYLSPRFAPSQRAWVLFGPVSPVSPVVPASSGRDGDDR